MSGAFSASSTAADMLYVVGNGFDLHHGIDSSYGAFGRFLASADRAAFRTLERYYSVDEEFWWQFESQLANLDTDALIDDAGSVLASYSDENWSDAGHGDYQYEIEQVVHTLSETLRARFGDWVRQLQIPARQAVADRLLFLNPDARYLTFNYTDTLQSTSPVGRRSSTLSGTKMVSS